MRCISTHLAFFNKRYTLQSSKYFLLIWPLKLRSLDLSFKPERHYIFTCKYKRTYNDSNMFCVYNIRSSPIYYTKALLNIFHFNIKSLCAVYIIKLLGFITTKCFLLQLQKDNISLERNSYRKTIATLHFYFYIIIVDYPLSTIYRVYALLDSTLFYFSYCKNVLFVFKKYKNISRTNLLTYNHCIVAFWEHILSLYIYEIYIFNEICDDEGHWRVELSQ